jgi:hypothetical protein
MRHASGQFYGVSAPVARYIKQNAPILHHYANEVLHRCEMLQFCCRQYTSMAVERSHANVCKRCHSQDITVGTWMLGLDVDFVDERRMCCANADECHKQVCSVHWHICCSAACASLFPITMWHDCKVS